MLALQDALSSGYDEALILDTENTVNEGSGENFFIVKNETLITPGLSTVLDGITRKTIIQLAADLEISTEEKKIELDEVYNCDEAFFTGTAAEVTPIIQINNESIGNRKPGKITSMLQENYFKLITGRYNRHSDWLTII
jgi:branched-chain amino acid aminotransferase